MPAFVVPPIFVDDGSYFVAGKASPAERGIKIHISANSESAQRICLTVLDYLGEMKVLTKVRKTSEEMARVASDNQMRKFITIYPDNARQLGALLNTLDKLLLQKMPSGARKQCLAIDGDAPCKLSGYLYLRFGEFKKFTDDDDRVNVSEQVLAYLANPDGPDPFVLDGGRHKADAAVDKLAAEQDSWAAYEAKT